MLGYRDLVLYCLSVPCLVLSIVCYLLADRHPTAAQWRLLLVGVVPNGLVLISFVVWLFSAIAAGQFY